MPIVTAELMRFTQDDKNGRPRKLIESEEVQLRERILAGPIPQDAVCSLRGEDACRIINEQFGMQYSWPGVYVLLHWLGLSYLVPKPRHKKNDPEKMLKRLKEAPFLPKESGKKDQKNDIDMAPGLMPYWSTRYTDSMLGSKKSSRPTTVKQTEYECIYLFGVVNPLTGASSALLVPTVNTDYTNHHLQFISEQTGPDVHVILVLDQACWQIAKALKVPENISLLYLPSYSPELNAIERLWGYLKSHYLSNRAYAGYEDLLNTCRDAWNKIIPEKFCSICQSEWIPHEN